MGPLTNPVLVLNKHWQAVQMMTMFNAVCKVYAGRAVVVGTDYAVYAFDEWILNWEDAVRASKVAADKLIRTPGCVFVAPEVIRLTEYGQYKIAGGFSRRSVFARDHNTCQYCGRKFKRSELSLDHVVPRSRGGRTNWENIVLACLRCNCKKADRTPREAGMKLIREPRKPHWTQMRSPLKQRPPSWEKFLGELYWNIELDEDED